MIDTLNTQAAAMPADNPERRMKNIGEKGVFC
jgi:hypothetical protein